jgi:signal transduction histidine kinase
MDMNGILNQAITENDDPKSLDLFLLLKERTQKLDSFLKDIIDYSRNKKESIQLSDFNLNKLVDEVIENFKFIIGADRIKFIKEFDTQFSISSDRVRLYIILNNVVANAVKYHRTAIKDKWIKIKASINHGELSIEVSDNGQGIDPDVLPKIFNMFFRGTNQSKGSGLGLYIVRETIENLEGSISVDSTLNSGTSFTILIPLRASSSDLEIIAQSTIITKES